jgi:hypothetical protein
MTGGRWECNVKVDIKEIGYENMDWIHQVHNLVQWGTSEQVNEASSSMKDQAFLEYLSDY